MVSLKIYSMKQRPSLARIPARFHWNLATLGAKRPGSKVAPTESDFPEHVVYIGTWNRPLGPILGNATRFLAPVLARAPLSPSEILLERCRYRPDPVSSLCSELHPHNVLHEASLLRVAPALQARERLVNLHAQCGAASRVDWPPLAAPFRSTAAMQPPRRRMRGGLARSQSPT